MLYIYQKVLKQWPECPSEITDFLDNYEQEIKDLQEYIVCSYGHGWHLLLSNQSLGDGAYVQFEVLKHSKDQLSARQPELYQCISDVAAGNHYIHIFNEFPVSFT